MGAFLIAGCVALPLGFIIRSLFSPPSEDWEMVVEFFLRDYIKDTLIMVGVVGVTTTIIGVLSAWIVTIYEFPLKKFFVVALMFPLAVPTYVAAYGYGFLLESGTDILLWVRANYGSEAMARVDLIRTYTIAGGVLSATLYPYIYIGARISFADFSQSYLESSRLLGRGLIQTFLRVALPLARPGIIGGVTLVLMEVLNEYGAMQYFGINTLTTGIFLLWSNMGDLESAVRLAAIMLIIVFSLIIMERLLRGRKQFSHQRGSRKASPAAQTSRKAQIFSFLFCATLFSLTFLVPVISLLRLASHGWEKIELLPLISPLWKSISVAGGAAMLILAASFFLAYASRLYPSLWMRGLTRISLLGYALPGAVVAVAIMTTSGLADKWLAAKFDTTSLVFSGTAFALIIAYMIRFLAVGLQPVEAGMKRIHAHMDEASASLGRGRIQTFFRIHLPMMSYPAMGALMMLFIDLMKELPLTLILRPFNFNTLATKTYGLIQGEERLAEGAVPALLLISVGLIGVLILRRLLLRQLNT